MKNITLNLMNSGDSKRKQHHIPSQTHKKPDTTKDIHKRNKFQQGHHAHTQPEKFIASEHNQMITFLLSLALLSDTLVQPGHTLSMGMFAKQRFPARSETMIIEPQTYIQQPRKTK